MFVYYEVAFRLRTEMLGSACQASVYDAHVLQKAQKMIKQANKLKGKLTKELDKWAGYPISEDKQLSELTGIVRSYQAYVGRNEQIPDTPEKIADYVKELEEELQENVEKSKRPGTIFLKNDEGHPIISSHMILGNLKENLRIITNNSTKSKDERIMKSKVSIGETMALDVKPLEEYMTASKDIMRLDDGSPDLLERTIRFERMGRTESAIALSERLPVDTEFKCTLRVREDSVFAQDNAKNLKTILSYGKANGLGPWRGSGMRGQYYYKIKKVKNPDQAPKGWT